MSTVMPPDPRCHPLIALDTRTIETMLAPVAAGAALREIARVEGGLTNTVYRVTTADGTAYALRVSAAGRSTFAREHRLLRRLSGTLPVPEVLLADASGAYPYMVYRWIEGITLNACRRRTTPAALLPLAEPLGRLLARVAGSRPIADLRDHGEEETDGEPSEPLRIAAQLAGADERLRAGLARQRLGGPLADRLRKRLLTSGPRLEALEGNGLVHGDFGGRNVLVQAAGDGGWAVSGVLDWESAAEGSGLWDVGSLFRYPRRYTPEFRAAFASGYRRAQGELPRDWWEVARLLDATRLVGILSEARELPTVFAECRELIASLVAGSPRVGTNTFN